MDCILAQHRLQICVEAFNCYFAYLVMGREDSSRDTASGRSAAMVLIVDLPGANPDFSGHISTRWPTTLPGTLNSIVPVVAAVRVPF